jgi:hypothetical protein
MKSANLDPSQNKWKSIFDFNDSEHKNWKIIDHTSEVVVWPLHARETINSKDHIKTQELDGAVSCQTGGSHVGKYPSTTYLYKAISKKLLGLSAGALVFAVLAAASTTLWHQRTQYHPNHLYSNVKKG